MRDHRPPRPQGFSGRARRGRARGEPRPPVSDFGAVSGKFITSSNAACLSLSVDGITAPAAGRIRRRLPAGSTSAARSARYASSVHCRSRPILSWNWSRRSAGGRRRSSLSLSCSHRFVLPSRAATAPIDMASGGGNSGGPALSLGLAVNRRFTLRAPKGPRTERGPPSAHPQRGHVEPPALDSPP